MEQQRDSAELRAAQLVAGGCGRVRRGVLQYESEHKRIGANVWERAWVEAGRGELRLWKGVDATQAGVTPTTEPMRRLRLEGAKVELTKSPRKEEAHSFRVTLSLASVAGGGAVGEAKHVLATDSAEALAEWIATIRANVNLCALPSEEQEVLIADDERASEAEELQEQLTGMAVLCAGMCAKLFAVIHVCCGRCLEDDEREYRAVTPKKAGAAGDPEWEDVGAGGLEAAAGAGATVYLCKQRATVRATSHKSSKIVGFCDANTRVEVYEEMAVGEPGAPAGHRRLRLAEGWVDSSSGVIKDGRAMFVYFEPVAAGMFSSYWKL